MTAVVDASVLVATLTSGDARGRWAEARVERHSLTAPELVMPEASQTLRRLEFNGTASRTEASIARYRLLGLDIDLYPFAPFAERTWELRHNITIYDAWYVALAEALSCPLLTLDRRLARAPGPTCEIITPPDLRVVREPAITTGWTPFSSG